MDISGILFGLVAWVGHCLIVIFSHNRFYGLPLSHKTTDGIQFVHFLWLCFGPVILFFFWSGQIPLGTSGDPVWLTAILWLCFAAAAVGLPADLLLRALRRGQGVPTETLPAILDVAPLGAAVLDLRGPGLRGLLCKIPGNRSLYPVLRQVELVQEQLPPAWDGLTILHLSDLHVQKNPTPEFFQGLARTLRPLEPDIIAFSGDLVEKGDPLHGEIFREFLSGLKFKEAGLAILGNHDFWHPIEPTLAILKRQGYRHLGNRRSRMAIRGVEMAISGLEYPWNAELPEGWGERHKDWTLCLSHTPDHFPRFAQSGPGLMLAGHVHGGQICFPIVGPIIMPSIYGRYYDRGWFQKGQAFLHVSEGLSGGHPLRFGLNPGVCLITLRTGKS